jgi:nifR3 family TIM-barrel protein
VDIPHLDATGAGRYSAQKLGTRPIPPSAVPLIHGEHRVAAVDATAIHPISLRLHRLANNLVLAPMAGVSNLPFRLIAREAGAAMGFSETVSAKGLVMGGHKTRRLLASSPREAPVAFQLFGSEEDVLAEACRILEADGVEWIDLNVGCPVKKFIRNRAGSALLRDLPRAARIVRAMRASFSGTLSVKMRTGWDDSSIVAPEFARMAADAGAELLSVHGRTRAQQYTGRADRASIRRVVAAVPDVPVLANGDVTKAQDVFDMLHDTGAAGVMIGRGAFGNPWIFAQALALAERRTPRSPTREERYATISRHVELMDQAFPDRRAFAANLKKYVAAYSKGMRGGSRFRQAALESADLDEILGLTRDFFAGRERAA